MSGTTADRLAGAVEAWLAATDPQPPDALMSAARTMAAVERTRQLSRWWPPPALVRPVRPVPALGASAQGAWPGGTDPAAGVPATGWSRRRRMGVSAAVALSVLAVVAMAVGLMVSPLVLQPPHGEQTGQVSVQASPSPPGADAAAPGPGILASAAPYAPVAASTGRAAADATDGRHPHRPR